MIIINTAEKIINQDNRANIIPFPTRFSMPVMQSMAATDSYTEALYERTAEQQDKGNGMSAFPEDIYNSMIKYSLANGKIRNAMYLICSANWGMRYSDVVRVRFCHIFDSEGRLREYFTIPYGEKKTGKLNIYYNNAATARIIEMYLTENPDKTPYDYLFISESGNKKTKTLREIESEELYGFAIYNAEKEIKNLKKAVERTVQSYITGVFSAEEYKNIRESIDTKLLEEHSKLAELTKKSVEYISPNPEADRIRVVSPICSTAAEDIIKQTLEAIGIFPKNKRNQTAQTNLDCKLNTHSFRKTFGEFFYKTGCDLRENGQLNIDPTMLNLLQQKFMHTNMSTTNRYNKDSERAFRIICTNMNVGLGILEQF